MGAGVRFARGAVAASRKTALQAGLNLPNESSIRDNYTTHPGLFFAATPYQGSTTPSEVWANSVAFRETKIGENKIGVVIYFNVTAENFHILQGRIYAGDRDERGKNLHTYTQVNDYTEISKIRGKTLVRFEDLSHEDLIELGLVVGFQRDDRSYEYQTYQEWSNRLGVRAHTRDEIATTEGTLPQMRI